MPSYTARFDSLYCEHTSDYAGLANDEVWMLLQVDGGVPVRYPYQPMTAHSMAAKDTWTFSGDNAAELILTFEHDINIQMFDQDVSLLVGQSDFLGCTGMTSYSVDTSPRNLTNGSSSSYKLYWTALNWGVE